jgi:hypothetical protein
VTSLPKEEVAVPADAADAADAALAADPPAASTDRGRIVGLLRNEWTLASLAGLALAILMTWPTVLHLGSTVPKDLPDPMLQAWQLAWSGHAVTHDPLHLWHSNTFYPARYTFAFSDTLLGYLPANLIGTGPVAAVVRYNVLFLNACAMAFTGAYALLRQLGASRIAASVAGLAFAWAPWRYSQTGHLNIMSTGGIALAFAMLLRGHGWSPRDGYRPERVRPGWALAGWLVAAWQIALGFGIGVPFAYALGGSVALGYGVGLVRGWRPPRRLVSANVAGVAAFLAVSVFMMYPYLRVIHEYPQARIGMRGVASFSPPALGLLVAPEDSLLWGSLHHGLRGRLGWWPEMTMLPGYTIYALAALGLFVSVWRVWLRALLAVAAVACMLCSLGTLGPHHGLPYRVIYHLPGFDGLRTPGRLVLWTTLLLCVLAAGAVTAVARRGGWLPRTVTLVVLALVFAEGLNKMPVAQVPAEPAGYTAVSGPMLVLPTDLSSDKTYMMWSTDGFPALVNGGSSFNAPGLDPIRAVAEHFPDAVSVAELRRIGVRHVVVLRHEVAGTPYAGAANGPTDALGLTREEKGGLIIYTLAS